MQDHESEQTGELVNSHENENKKLEKRREMLAYLHDIVYVLPVLLIVMTLLFKIVFVSGPSMKQTLVDGDCLILMSNVLCKDYKPGDIVVAAKKSFKDGEPIIKRVIATEGQQVDIDFDEGIVYVDGMALDEPYANTPTNLYEGTEFPLTVSDNCYLVMGDNRNDSKDSRSLEIGLIDKREILGKAKFLMLPGPDSYTGKRHFNRIGVL